MLPSTRRGHGAGPPLLHRGTADGSLARRLSSPVCLLLLFALSVYASYTATYRPPAAIPAAAVLRDPDRGAAGAASRPAARPAAPSSDEQPRAAAAAAAASSARVPARAASGGSGCPNAPLRPFHTILTAQATTYQQWQSEMMYHHWRKQRAAQGPCGEMGGFTRLTASPDGKPDAVANRVPSFFVKELTYLEIHKYKGFGVLNRPLSIVLAFEQGLFDRIEEDYVFIAETDHILMQPLPNLSPHKLRPAAFTFSYMVPNPAFGPMIERFWPAGGPEGFRKIDPVGPSPVIIHKEVLRDVAHDYVEKSKALKMDAEADGKLGWVIEMWGWAIACAARGLSFELIRNFQIELSSELRFVPEDFHKQHYIFHYTYGLEYTMDGKPQGVWQIGEWSLDKRHYGNAYPPKGGLLTPPPKGANSAAFYLQKAWVDAVEHVDGWPDSKTMGTIGWRRNKITAQELEAHPWAEQLVGSRWRWAGDHTIELRRDGSLDTPWGRGSWSVVGSAEGEWTLGLDFSANLHNVRLDPGFQTAVSHRVGDNQQVTLTRAAAA